MEHVNLRRFVLCLPYLVALTAAAGESPEELKKSLPWDKLSSAAQARIVEFVPLATVQHLTRSEVFEADPRLYLTLLHRPEVTLELWKQLGFSDNASLRKTSGTTYVGNDGARSKGNIEFLYRSPELNVMWLDGTMNGLVRNGLISAQSLLIVRTAYYKEPGGRTYVKHQLSGYVHADTSKMVLGRAIKPLIRRSVESSLDETQLFVSLLCRLANHDTPKMLEATRRAEIDDEIRERLVRLIGPASSK